ncbi:MAG TPA: adenylate/guanylate cyclase domain-containing protein [Gemmatimonadota bacterium]|nr:adenylate/guanylate cyclase domain-containing protein [Gemmatimonadota bacterium]
MTAAILCPGCQAELAPTDRFCSSCGALRPRYCSACGATLGPEARFCGQCGTKVEQGSAPTGQAPPGLEAPALHAPPEASPEPEAPAALREKFETVKAELQGDRREVVVLFADLSGFTAMSEKMDPESVTILMNRLLQDLAAAVYEYEGYVDKFIGDAIMALFGAPLAHEDDPERAVLAALAMQDAVTRHNETSDIPLALRVGINVGEVVAAHLGAGGRMQYTVLGDTVNVASRLESQAKLHKVLVSEPVYRRVDHRFEANEVPPLTLRGKSEPVRAFEIGAVRAAAGAGRLTETPFVGRVEELLELGRFLEDVSSGQPASLLIEAEAGGGKTRLVEEALSRFTGELRRIDLRFTSVRLPGQRAAPSEIFHQLFPADEGDPVERALTLLGDEAERDRAGILMLAEASDAEEARLEETDPATARQNRWIAIASLLQRMSRERPLLLWVEDAHWVDEAAGEFLGFLLLLLADDPASLLVTGRPEVEGAWLPRGIGRLTLSPLDEESARALLGDLSADPAELGVESWRELIRRSQGNPLYLEQLARSLRESGGKSAVPGTVQGLIMERIDRLAAPIQVLLQMAAVLGTRFSAQLLRRMYALEPDRVDFDAGLRDLEDAGFLVAADEERIAWAFRHALTQEVAYGGLLLRVRKVLHESAARLGEDVFAERLDSEAAFFAHHYWEAGLARDAAPHLWIAGRAAAEAYELPAAELFLGRLAEAARESGVEGTEALLTADDRARFLEMYGKVLLHRGRLDDADVQFRALEREGESAGRGEWVSRGLEYRGRTAWYRGELDTAEDLFERGLGRLPSGQHQIEADLHNDLGIVYYYRGRPDDAFAQHTAALDLRKGLGDRLGMAKSYTNIGNLLADFRDDLEGAEEHYRLALEMAKAVGDRQMQYSAVFNLATILTDRGQWVQAIEMFRQGERLLEEIGWGHARYQNILRQAEIEIALGRIDAALRHLQACLSRGDAVLEPVNRVNTRSSLFDAYLRACDDESAEVSIGEARRLVDELHVDEALEGVLLREGRLRASQGRWVDAAAAFEGAAEVARSQNHASVAALADAHRSRALAYAGGPAQGGSGIRPAEGARGEERKKTPARAVIDFLYADAGAERDPTSGIAASLERVADEAARLADPGLERAAAARLSQVWRILGDEAAAAAAIDRAARAMAVIEAGLSKDMAEAFAAHPRNASLRQVLEAREA